MLVSCVMPTRARPAFAAEALTCFLAQTWADKELVIVDDADAPSFPDGLYLTDVQYHRLSKRLTIGAKRNLAVSRAWGDIIATFDDDDQSAPGRLTDQVTRLVSSGADITGYHSMRFTDGAKWWQYTGSEECYALGTSLVYTREYWMANPFKTDVECGEDGHFITPARQSGRIANVDAGQMMWARDHRGNTDKRERPAESKLWKEIECPQLQPNC